jgi:ribosomal protein S18 acetylase RimI-like enzyme
MPAKSTEISIAMECFAQGFAFTRSFTYPAVAQRIGRVWVIRDQERKRADSYRREEWAAHGVHPEQVDAIARKHTRGRFAICAIHGMDESDAPLRAEYKALGYRLGTTEPLMMHRLKQIAKWSIPLPIRRVVTPELADRVAKASGRREIMPEHLKADAPLRLYTALDGDRPVGWLKSITIHDRTWVSNVHVKPEHRRRGIGKSLLARMLRDDRKHGSCASILLASHTGALLYDRMGYERLGTLLLFTPKR